MVGRELFDHALGEIEVAVARHHDTLAEDVLDVHGRIRTLYALAYGRPPTEIETQRDLAYLDRFRQTARGKIPDPELEPRAWRSLCRAILAANEFMFAE